MQLEQNHLVVTALPTTRQGHPAVARNVPPHRATTQAAIGVNRNPPQTNSVSPRQHPMQTNRGGLFALDTSHLLRLSRHEKRLAYPPPIPRPNHRLGTQHTPAGIHARRHLGKPDGQENTGQTTAAIHGNHRGFPGTSHHHKPGRQTRGQIQPGRDPFSGSSVGKVFLFVTRRDHGKNGSAGVGPTGRLGKIRSGSVYFDLFGTRLVI